jgi:hypothetical protein
MMRVVVVGEEGRRRSGELLEGLYIAQPTHY